MTVVVGVGVVAVVVVVVASVVIVVPVVVTPVVAIGIVAVAGVVAALTLAQHKWVLLGLMVHVKVDVLDGAIVNSQIGVLEIVLPCAGHRHQKFFFDLVTKQILRQINKIKVM